VVLTKAKLLGKGPFANLPQGTQKACDLGKKEGGRGHIADLDGLNSNFISLGRKRRKKKETLAGFVSHL